MYQFWDFSPKFCIRLLYRTFGKNLLNWYNLYDITIMIYIIIIIFNIYDKNDKKYITYLVREAGGGGGDIQREVY